MPFYRLSRGYLFILLWVIPAGIYGFSFSEFFGLSDKKEEAILAKVGVLDFANQHNLIQHRYLSNSIADAIKTRLNKIFEYKSISRKQIVSTFSKVLKQKKRKWHQMRIGDVRALATMEKLDVVIYGRYFQTAFGEKVDKVRIITNIYFSHKDESIVLNSSISELNNRLVGVAERIADSALEKIKTIIGERKDEDQEARKKPIILVDAQSESEGEEKKANQDKLAKELINIKKNLEKIHGDTVIFLSDYLKENSAVKAPQTVQSKSSLIRWSKENKIGRIVRVRIRSSIVQIEVINKDKTKAKNKIEYEIDAPKKIKTAQFRQLTQALKVKEPKRKRGKTSLTIGSVQKFEWKLFSYEVGLSSFYQITLTQSEDNVRLNPQGGGFTFYGRAPLSTFLDLIREKPDGGSGLSRWLYEPLSFGLGFSAAYLRESTTIRRDFSILDRSVGVDLNGFYQTYTFFFDLGYLYPITQRLRMGFRMRPGYYVGSFSRDSQGASSLSSETSYRSFTLPIGIEINYAIFDKLSLNVELGDHLDLLGVTTHGLYVSVGISYLFVKQKRN